MLENKLLPVVTKDVVNKVMEEGRTSVQGYLDRLCERLTRHNPQDVENPLIIEFLSNFASTVKDHKRTRDLDNLASAASAASAYTQVIYTGLVAYDLLRRSGTVPTLTQDVALAVGREVETGESAPNIASLIMCITKDNPRFVEAVLTFAFNSTDPAAVALSTDFLRAKHRQIQ